MICRRKTDNRMTLTCPFHGWTFRNDGTLLKVKDPDGAGYPATFNVNGSHNMTKVARFESYRGFLFGSLNPDVLPLSEHLGDTTKVIDMLVDQSPEGLEVLRGSSTYTYDGNWKVQAENGADGYHVTATHWNYAATTVAAQHRRVQERHQGARRRQLGQVRRRLLVLPQRPPVPVDLGGQPAGPASVGQARRTQGEHSATPRASSWSRAPATCACIRMSI